MGSTRQVLRVLRGGSAVLLIVAAGAVAASSLMDTGLPRDLMISAASSLAATFFALHLFVWAGDGRERRLRRSAVEVARLDPAPVFLTDAEGVGTGYAVSTGRVPGEARSVVLHDPAGDKVACADLTDVDVEQETPRAVREG